MGDGPIRDVDRVCLTGMAATYFLTGRTLHRERIPSRSVIIAMLCGVVGMFDIPAVGLPIGFFAACWAFATFIVGLIIYV